MLRTTMPNEKSFWKERSFGKTFKHYPSATILTIILSFLAWHFLVAPVLGEAKDAVFGEETAQVIQLDLMSAEPALDENEPGTAARYPTECSSACSPSSAAKKFRRGGIKKGTGLAVQRTFDRPAKSQHIIIKKFQRMLDRKYSGRTVARTSSGYCTSDSYSCARTWYERTKEARCSAATNVYAGGRGRCSEYPALSISPTQTWAKVKVLECGIQQAALFFVPGATWVKMALFSGNARFCWSLFN